MEALTAAERTLLEARRTRGPVDDELLARALELRGLLLASSGECVQKRTWMTTPRGLAALASR